MSQQNVEVIRRAFDDFNRRDWASWETLHHGDMVCIPMKDWPDWPEAEPVDGFEAWLERVLLLLEPWEDQRLVIESLRTTGDLVLVGIRWVATGHESQIEVDMPFTGVYTITDGKIARIEFFRDPDTALEAAGLSEEAISDENVAVVRSFFDVWNSGDMEAVRELYDPDAIVRAARGWPEPGPFVGRDAVMQQLSEARAAFDNDWAEIVDDLLATGDRVLARMIWHATGRGPQSDMEWTIVFTLRDRLIIGAEFVWDHAEALKAAGLSE